MEAFDKRMAQEVIEDTLTDLGTAQGRGTATGVCGAFYMCGLITADEWQAYLKRIQAGPDKVRSDTVFGLNCLTARGERRRALN